ncbi:uncharacterized protein TrAtP1_006186 [Trichoderma atroviride]|nr:hypothetical protein TrAtP1_006186 [Trichoderma atroviride]
MQESRTSGDCDRDYSSYRYSLTERPRTDHHTVGMIGAFLLLDKKRNLMTLDRLSILANISRYTYHLGVAKLIEEHPDISFTACFIALTFANGDLSLVTNRTLNIFTPRPNEVFWLSSGNDSVYSRCSDGYTINALRGRSASIENPSFIINAGLKVLKAVIKQLFISNKQPLVELVVSLAVGHFDSPRTFHWTIQQLHDWYCRGSDWPSHIELGKIGVSLDMNDEGSDEDSTKDEKLLPNLFGMPDSGHITYEPDPAVYEMEANDALIPGE